MDREESLKLVESIRLMDYIVEYKLGPKEFRILLIMAITRMRSPREISIRTRQPVGSVRVMFQTLRAKGFIEMDVDTEHDAWPKYSLSDLGRNLIFRILHPHA